ncbi:MAG: uncharacterized protein JWN17_34, partial [Frankiales bacterium]|nr:uncharacterized protein [Frankiales bacterium]
MPARTRKPVTSAPAAGTLPATFTPDPRHLLPPVGTPSGPPATQRFRVQRARDLVNLQVSAYGCELASVDGATVLRPVVPGARLEVRLPFQHLGEQSSADGDPALALPVHARTAGGTRLVFGVPADEVVGYSVAGILAALSRLPLVVVPLALPRPAPRGVVDRVPVVHLTDGLLLSRADGGLVVTTTTAQERTSLLREDVGAVAGALRASLRWARARSVLARESATNLTRREVADLADLLRRAPSSRPVVSRPRAPRTDETAIEAPYRLLLSPSSAAGWAHATVPVEATEGRVELWHSRLGVRGAKGKVDELDAGQRVVRAVWNRDRDLGYGAGEHDTVPFRMSLDSRDRTVLVTQTSDPKALVPPRPVDAHKLSLSALGASLDLHGHWPAENGVSPEVLSWDHVAPTGRDQFVKVVYPGYLFPFGHAAALVKQTVRRVDLTGAPVATLHTEFFLVVTQPVRAYSARDMPFSEVRVRPLTTLDLLDPNSHGVGAFGQTLFWPTLASTGQPLEVLLECLDRDGRRLTLHTPLLFVGERITPIDPPPATGPAFTVEVAPAATVVSTWASRPIDGLAQHIALAESATPGETSVETHRLRFTGTPAAAPTLSSTPSLVDADVVLPAVQRLGPLGAATTTTVVYPAAYLADGYGGSNAVLEQFLTVQAAVAVDFTKGSDRAGGFLAPSLSIQAVTRRQGAVGDPAGYTSAGFDAKTALAGLLPKLFGLFDLTDLLDALGVFDHAPKFLTSALDQIAALLQDLSSLQRSLHDAEDRLTADAGSAPTKALQSAAADALTALAPKAAAVTSAAEAVVAAVTGLQQPASP